ncbi:hypothetical protein ACFV9D_05925 [Streptomyces sp. NPDC059875]|uniref:hypothetical protein n=1 Tax=unclassified Streptomyces TaxID=2593676 RepID=UPI00364EAD87
MSVRAKPSSQDNVLEDMFGATVDELYQAAVGPQASAALTRAMELRSFLALAEEQVARVRDRVHQAMAPDRDMDELSAQDLHLDAQWLEAALDARASYRAALGELLRTMPPLQQPGRPDRLAQQPVTTTLPAAAPALSRAGAARTRRP